MSEAWERNVALKLGVGGAIPFTPARVGQTLHLPCCRGHVVDHYINARMPPEAVAKRLMRAGWTVGNKLTCPEHSRKEKPKGKYVPTPPIRESTIRPKIIEALEAADWLSLAELGERTGEKANSVAYAMRQLLEENAVAREGKGNAASPHLYALASRVPEQEEETLTTNAALQPDLTGLSTTQQVRVAPEPVTSDAARTAKRLTLMALEDSFVGGRFKAGTSDATIAEETGLSVAQVAKLREEFFGPIKVPSEVEEITDKLEAVCQQTAAVEAEFTMKIGQLRQEVGALKACLEQAVRKNGWQQ